MKLKSTILATLAAAAILTGCNKEEGVTTAPENGGTSSMLFKIELPQTRAIEPGAPLGASKIKSMYVYAETAAGVVLKTYEVHADSLDKAQTTGTFLEQVPNAADSIRVAANYDGKDGRITSADTGIAAFQEGIVNVPYMGKGVIDKSGIATNGDGHKLVKAAVSISPVAARFEIKGGIEVDLATNGVYAVDVEAVYINNYRIDITDKTALYTAKNNSDYDGNGDWEGTPSFAVHKMGDTISMAKNTGSYYTPNLTPDHNLGIMNGKVAAYQFFPVNAATEQISAPNKADVANACPHIVLNVKVYLTSLDLAAGISQPNKWITITSFNRADGSTISNFEAGKIYTLNLNALTSSFQPNTNDPKNPITPTDPNPEEPKSDLTLTVTVVDWTEVPMTPNI